MTAFSDWYAEATGRGGDLTRVAQNAQRPARYEQPAAQQQFHEAIGRSRPFDKNAYGQSCYGHHLTGEPVDESALVPHLVRLVNEAFLRHGVRGLGWALLDGTDLVGRPSKTHWQPVSEALADPDLGDALLFVPARPVDGAPPDDRAVFATFDGADCAPVPAAGAPQCSILDRVRRDVRPGESEADYAVYRLATDTRPANAGEVRAKTLLSFPRDRVGTCRFPVPPDAGWNPFFRAMAPGDPHSCGRTWPEGSSEDDHRLCRCGENEVVHRNAGIPCREVFVISLGETTIA